MVVVGGADRRQWWAAGEAATPPAEADVRALRALYEATRTGPIHKRSEWRRSDGFAPPPPRPPQEGGPTTVTAEDHAMAHKPTFGVLWRRGRVARLDLPDNGLRGDVPRGLAALSACARLCLFGNALTGTLDPSTLPATLLHLDLGGNQLTGSLLPTIASLAKLKRLHLEKNRLSGSLPRELGYLTRLEVLTAHANALDGELPETLTDCASLQKLWLFDNAGLSGRIPDGLPASLVSLLLTETQILGPVPEDLLNRGCDVQIGPFGIVGGALPDSTTSGPPVQQSSPRGDDVDDDALPSSSSNAAE
mmetsp:Transcript_14027/g.55965  ORF Transcript_14027/g.55965 Transcript_14027/m.55965 type:complete len:306 (-) Transcript_14027:153-1070(-)